VNLSNTLVTFFLITIHIAFTALSVGRGNGRHSAVASQMLQQSASFTRRPIQYVCRYPTVW